MRSLVAPIDPPPICCLDAAERVSVAGYCSTSLGPMPTVNADVTRTSLICGRMQYEFGSPMATVNLLSHVCKVSAYNVGKPNPRMFRMAYERSRSLPRCTLHAARGMLHVANRSQRARARGSARRAQSGQPVHGMMPIPAAMRSVATTGRSFGLGHRRRRRAVAVRSMPASTGWIARAASCAAPQHPRAAAGQGRAAAPARCAVRWQTPPSRGRPCAAAAATAMRS
jgi:hypothetical protein